MIGDGRTAPDRAAFYNSALVRYLDFNDKSVMRTKEEADHSLQYMVAVAILDDQVTPEQYLPERIQRFRRPELVTAGRGACVCNL